MEGPDRYADKCSVCNEILIAPEVIPALGHIDKNGDGICDRCSATLLLLQQTQVAIGVT